MSPSDPARLLDRLRGLLQRRPAPASDPFLEEHSTWSAQAARRALAASTRTVHDTSLLGHPCRMEIGPAPAGLFTGMELRARVDLRLDRSVAVVALDRAFKEMLAAQAYAILTQGDQTALGMGLREEMRWLAVYTETGWPMAAAGFWQDYVVLEAQRGQAGAWIDEELARAMLAARLAAPAAPVVLALLQGRVYLRTQLCAPGQAPAMLKLLTKACAKAAGAARPQA